ncbi:MAG TPA: M23 family metallopeptidase [Bacillales bacterium]|nr:M23 family metallopeptidase [Bacillales bacterium]
MRKWIIFLAVFGLWISLIQGAGAEEKNKNILEKRMALFRKMEAVTQIPWYDFAAIDQYERDLRNARKDLPDTKGIIAVYYSPRDWVGLLNPYYNDKNPLRIKVFGGIGLDGNGDGRANRENPHDVLFTLANYLQPYGLDPADFRIALWDRYQRGETVQIITGFAKVYEKFGRLDLDENAFPLPLSANYTINNTYGDRRGWGGLRSHEGVDIFANYGVPVKSTTYGYVETIGWNRFGGWRIGIRSMSNVYHYYAHLKGYAKGIEKGDVVKPGEIIGYVGSSGYGPEGTQGKFPPHLHYGMYKDNGYREYPFDPYYYLKIWEHRARHKKK